MPQRGKSFPAHKIMTLCNEGIAVVAQLVEHHHGKVGVIGSIPINGSRKFSGLTKQAFSGRVKKLFCK